MSSHFITGSKAFFVGTAQRKPIVLIACPGADRVKRGFETFATECFRALSESSEIDTYFAKGSGARLGDKEMRIPCFGRTGTLAKLCSFLFRKHPYYLEQVTFGLLLIPRIIALKPDVIYFSDGTLGNVLWRLRKLFKFSYKLLYSNGGPSHPPYPKCDHIQQLTDAAFEQGQAHGVSQTLLPYGFSPLSISKDEKTSLRASLGLPTEAKIVVCVAALDKRHKRIDHLISEIASMSEPKPFLLLLGEKTDETNSLLNFGSERLGVDNFLARTVSTSEVSKMLKASDVFVLPSVLEGFGRSVVEAGMTPLPCIVHNSRTMRFILDELGEYVNMEAKGELGERISKVLKNGGENLTLQAKVLRDRFGWDSLLPKYIKMILSLTFEKTCQE